MIDERFRSTHLAGPRRRLFRYWSGEATRSCGSGTAILAERGAGAPMGAIVLLDPARVSPADSGYLLVAGAVTHALRIGCNTIGRQSDNDVVIDDDRLHVSRRHCAIVVHSSGAAEIFDLASLNGTFVNDRRVTERLPVRSSDVVRLGGGVAFTVSLYNTLNN